MADTTPTDNDIKNLQTQANLLNQITLSLQENIGHSKKITEEYSTQNEIIQDINKGILSATESLSSLGSEIEKTNKLFDELKAQNFANVINGVLGNVSNDMTKVAESAETSTTSLNSALKSGSGLRKRMSERNAANIERIREIAKAEKENAKEQEAMSKAAAKAAKKQAESSEKVSNCFNNYSGNAIAFVKASVRLGATLLKGLSNALVIAKNVLTGTLSTLYNILKAVTSLPFAIANLGAQMGGALRKDIVEGLGNTFEGLKEKFDMSSYIGENIKSMRNMAEASILEFEKPSSEFVKYFGFQTEGMNKYLSNYGEMVNNIGVFGDTFAGEIRKAEQFGILYTKMVSAGGYSAEDQKYFAMEAFSSVKGLTTVMHQALMTTEKTAKRFKIDSKMLSKNFMTLRKDIILFGHLSNESLNETAAVMTKMGLEMKEAAAVFGKFSTFEDAANSAAILGQTFGMNLNAMDMIKAEKPEEIFGMFRNAMLDTGRTFDELSRYEKNIMVQQTGMSAEGLKAMMNYSAAGMTFEEAREKLEEDKPEKRQLKVLKQLQGAIKEIKKVLTPKSFGEALFKGLKTRIGLHKETRDTVMSLSDGYQALYEYAANMDPNTIVQLVRPIRYVIDIMKDIFESDSFRKGVSYLLKGFGTLLSNTFEITTPEQEFERVSKKLKTIKLKDLAPEAKQNLAQEISKLEQNMPENKQLRLSGDGDLYSQYEQAAKEEGKSLNAYLKELLSKNKSESKTMSDILGLNNGKIEGTTSFLTETLDGAAKTQTEGTGPDNPSNLSKLGGVTQKIVGALIKGSVIGLTALIKLLNRTLEKTDVDKLSSYSIIASITGVKESEAKQLFGGLTKALGETVEKGGVFFDIFDTLSTEIGNLVWGLAKEFGKIFAEAFKSAIGWDKNNKESDGLSVADAVSYTIPAVGAARYAFSGDSKNPSPEPVKKAKDMLGVFELDNLFAKSEYKFIGRDNKEIDLNTKAGVLGTGSGIVSSIMRDKEGMTNDLSEIQSLVNDIYTKNNFKSERNNSELKRKVTLLRKKIDDAISNNREDKLEITPILSPQDITLLKDLLVKDDLLHTLTRPEYAGTSGYYLELSSDAIKNRSGNTGTYSIINNK